MKRWLETFSAPPVTGSRQQDEHSRSPNADPRLVSPTTTTSFLPGHRSLYPRPPCSSLLLPFPFPIQFRQTCVCVCSTSTHTPSLTTQDHSFVVSPASAQIISTDHVIVRGRYSNVEVVLLGRTDHDPTVAVANALPLLLPSTTSAATTITITPQVQTPKQALSRLPRMNAPLLLPQQLFTFPQLQPPQGAVALLRQQPPASGFSKMGAGLAGLGLCLPLPAMPPSFLSALGMALEYHADVGKSHGRIGSNPPQDRLQPLMQAANALCAFLQGE